MHKIQVLHRPLFFQRVFLAHLYTSFQTTKHITCTRWMSLFSAAISKANYNTARQKHPQFFRNHQLSTSFLSFNLTRNHPAQSNYCDNIPLHPIHSESVSSCGISNIARFKCTMHHATEQDMLDIQLNLKVVKDKIEKAFAQAITDREKKQLEEEGEEKEGMMVVDSVAAAPTNVPLLIAVSKTKSADLLQVAYDAGQRDFGENYVQELVQKAAEMSHLSDLRWHFIGNVQSNKAKVLVSQVPTLYCVQTIDRIKIADALEKACATSPHRDTSHNQLRVMIQINTSGEDAKSGCQAEEAPLLASHILTKCPHLKLQGLMCIGAIDDVQGQDIPLSYTELIQARKVIAKHIGWSPQELDLSMGMSGDFEKAVRMGSTVVRVGSNIFGARPVKH